MPRRRGSFLYASDCTSRVTDNVNEPEKNHKNLHQRLVFNVEFYPFPKVLSYLLICFSSTNLFYYEFNSSIMYSFIYLLEKY